MRQAGDSEQWGFASTTSVPGSGTAVAWAVAVKLEKAQDDVRLRWLPNPTFPCPAAGLGSTEIALWLAAVSGGRAAASYEDSALNLDRAVAVLDRQERERLARFRHVDDRRSYLAAHAGARLMLANIIGRSPDMLQFRPSGNGKPILLDSSVEIDFSLSHARGVVAVAVSGAHIGVDVEPLRNIDHLDSMSAIVLSEPERSIVRSAPEATRSQLFLRYWTLKEALLKAATLGFSIPPRVVTLDAGAAPVLLSAPSELGSAAQWRLMAGVRYLTHRQ